jgi:GT2 family glycosyltransferase
MTIAIAVPNLNQGQFLAAALDSLRGDAGGEPVSVAVMDAGSTDGSVAILQARAAELTHWRSHRDAGQAPAINEGVRALCVGRPAIQAVAWLNADDVLLPGGLAALYRALMAHPEWSAVAGRGYCLSADGTPTEEIPTAPFSVEGFAHSCTICQPATLIRRAAWEAIGGLDGSLHMCFDYDLWWRLAHVGPIGWIDRVVAGSRDHAATKTRQRREEYFREAMALVRRETGAVSWHWCLSEAFERQANWTLGVRPPFGRKLLGAVQAAGAYVRWNWSAGPRLTGRDLAGRGAAVP